MKQVYKILFIFILFFSCSHTQINSKLVNKDGYDLLIGKISQKQLFYNFPEWKTNYDLYQADQELIGSIKKNMNPKIQIKVFLGTWCGDSREEVPKFLKIINSINLISEKNIQIYAVDRQKILDNNLHATYNINRVATFIFELNEQEFGRIIEYPDETLEKDILKILQKI